MQGVLGLETREGQVSMRRWPHLGDSAHGTRLLGGVSHLKQSLVLVRVKLLAVRPILFYTILSKGLCTLSGQVAVRSTV